MKKIFIAIAMASILAISMVGCGGSNPSSSSSSSSSSSAAVVASSSSSSAAALEVSNETYESILADYAAQMEAQTPILVEEYNAEAAGLTDLSEKAQLSNDKVQELAKISVAGTEKMAELMLKNGDQYSVYEDWANQLNDVYTELAQQITDAYMASAM